MAVITMGVLSGASTLLSSIMGGQQAVQQQAIQRAQHAEQEFQRRMQNQIKNRQIAKNNAAKWMANRKIAQAANEQRAKEEFYLQYNYDNASGKLSRGYGKLNAGIKSAMEGRNINLNSGTSRSLMRQALQGAKDGVTTQRMNFSNALVAAEAKQSQALARRDFGYAGQVSFMPAQIYQVSDSSIMQNALTSGLIQGGLAGIQAGMATASANRQIKGYGETPIEGLGIYTGV